MPRKYEEPPRTVGGFLSWVNEGGMDRLKNVLYVVLGPPLWVYFAWQGGHHVFAVCSAGLVVLPIAALALHSADSAPRGLASVVTLFAIASMPLLIWLSWRDFQH